MKPQRNKNYRQIRKGKNVNALLNIDEKDSAILDFAPNEGDRTNTKVSGLKR